MVCQASAETSDLDIFQSYQRWQPFKWLNSWLRVGDGYDGDGWWWDVNIFNKDIASKERIHIPYPIQRQLGRWVSFPIGGIMLGPLEG